MKMHGYHCEYNLQSYCDYCYNKNTDINEKNRMKFGRCKECFQINENLNDDCLPCIYRHLLEDFDKWTSGNGSIDKLIQDNQLSIKRHGLLEWIPYNRFEIF